MDPEGKKFGSGKKLYNMFLSLRVSLCLFFIVALVWLNLDLLVVNVFLYRAKRSGGGASSVDMLRLFSYTRPLM